MESSAGLSVRSCLGAAAVLVALQAQPWAQGCPVKDADFQRIPLVEKDPINEPQQIAIDKQNNVYWIERVTGNLYVYSPADKSAKVIGTVPTYMNGSGHGQSNSVGLIGLALAPDFETSHKLYLNYSPDTKSASGFLRVSRFTLNNGLLALGSEEKILEYPILYRCCHNGGDLRFGPDGLLYISTGDNTGGGWDEPYQSSMNPKNDNGKILRVRPHASGPGFDAPDGNLFKNAADGNPEVFVMGVRNPYRIDVDPRTGWLYWGDVGPDGPRMEEFDQARGLPGNYGYPAYYGDNIQSPSFSSYAAIAAQRPPVQIPFLMYSPSSDKAYTGKTTTTSYNIRASSGFGGPVYYYDGQSPSQHKFPPKYHGSYFIWDWHKQWIKVVTFTDDGYVKNLEDFPAFPWHDIIDVKFSADGELYVLVYGTTYRTNNPDDGLYKVVYNPPDAATCLPRAPELDTKTIANASPLGTAVRARTGYAVRADFVRRIGGRAFIDAGGASGEAVVMSLDGRELERVRLRGGQRLVPIGPAPAGLYFVRLRTPQGVWEQKTLL